MFKNSTEHFPLEKGVHADSVSYAEVLLTAYNSLLKFRNLEFNSEVNLLGYLSRVFWQWAIDILCEEFRSIL